MQNSQPRVLIIGAGLGGLALAQALRKHGISFQIFERDAGPNSRAQGWAVSLQWILNDLLSSTLRDGPPLASVSVDPAVDSRFSGWNGTTGDRTLHRGDDGKPHLRANRKRLREWLEYSLDIQWGKRFARYESQTDGVTAYFEDGSSAKGDILVGADGINSRVRTQLLAHVQDLNHVTPQLLPLLGILGEVRIDHDQYKRFQELGGSFYLVDAPGSRIFGGVKNVTEKGAEAYWMFNMYDPEATKAGYPLRHASQQELLEYAHKVVAGLDPKFTEIIRTTTADGILVPQLDVKDMVPHELPRGRVTLLGDAIHPMTYFRGEGANHAMKDGLDLGRIINAEMGLAYGMRDGKIDVEELLKQYESEMIPRSKTAVESSRAAALKMRSTV